MGPDVAAEASLRVHVQQRRAVISELMGLIGYLPQGIAVLQPYVGLRTGIVTDAVARLLRAGHVTEGRRGEPYTVTPSGLALLAGSTP